jgi:hypothetical protein
MINSLVETVKKIAKIGSEQNQVAKPATSVKPTSYRAPSKSLPSLAKQDLTAVGSFSFLIRCSLVIFKKIAEHLFEPLVSYSMELKRQR